MHIATYKCGGKPAYLRVSIRSAEEKEYYGLAVASLYLGMAKYQMATPINVLGFT